MSSKAEMDLVWLGLERELHDLCQPLTALQCQLELGQMIGDRESLSDAVNGALAESARMFAAIASMRDRLAAAQAEAEKE